MDDFAKGDSSITFNDQRTFTVSRGYHGIIYFAVLVISSLRNQRTIIVSSFGFTVLHTTLLSCVDGIVEVITIWVGIHVAAKTNQRAYTAFYWKIPNIVGAILVNTFPWSNKIGLLFSLWITGQCSTFLDVLGR
jgi:hypothetical protein